jgi:hypothetical protein
VTLEGDEHFVHINKTNSPIRDFASPVEFGGYRGNHSHDGGVILDESQGNRAPAQEDPFSGSLAGVLPVCAWSRLSLMRFFLIPSSFLKSKCLFG